MVRAPVISFRVRSTSGLLHEQPLLLCHFNRLTSHLHSECLPQVSNSSFGNAAMPPEPKLIKRSHPGQEQLSKEEIKVLCAGIICPSSVY